MNLTELAGTTGLLLVAILGGSNLGDGLTVRNLRSEELDLETELVVETPLDDIDVLLAVTIEDGLAELLGVLYDNSRILG